MNRLTPFLGLTVLIAGVPAFAQAADPQGDEVQLTRKRPKDAGTKPPVTKGVTWKFGFEKGRVTKFNITTTTAGNLADGTSLSIITNCITTETIKSVTKSGDGTIESRTDVQEITIDGKPMPNSSSSSSGIFVMGANGLVGKRIPILTNERGEILTKVWFITTAMPTPPTPVVPGDEWKTELDNPFLPDQKVIVTSQYETQGKFGTLMIYRVRINALIPTRENDEENADAIQVNGVYEFEPVKQRVVKSDITVDNLTLQLRGQKALVSFQGVTSMIGVPDQITPRSKPVKKRVKRRN